MSIARPLAAAALIAIASAATRAQTPAADAGPPRALDVTAELARQGRKAGVVMCHAGEASQAACEEHFVHCPQAFCVQNLLPLSRRFELSYLNLKLVHIF